MFLQVSSSPSLLSSTNIKLFLPAATEKNGVLPVQDALCINVLAVLPAKHFDFVNGIYASSLRNIVCLKFETGICSKGTKRLKNFNWGPFMIEETLLW